MATATVIAGIWILPFYLLTSPTVYMYICQLAVFAALSAALAKSSRSGAIGDQYNFKLGKCSLEWAFFPGCSARDRRLGLALPFRSGRPLKLVCLTDC